MTSQLNLGPERPERLERLKWRCPQLLLGEVPGARDLPLDDSGVNGVQRAIPQLQSRPTVITRPVTSRGSVETLHRSYVALGASPAAPAANEPLDLSKRENANSLDVMNALDERAGILATIDDWPGLRSETITHVSGVGCYPCLRNGLREYGSPHWTISATG